VSSHSDREPVIRTITFIVRMTANEAGHVAGIVEHVRSGRKERFDGVQAISGVIATLIERVDVAGESGT